MLIVVMVLIVHGSGEYPTLFVVERPVVAADSDGSIILLVSPMYCAAEKEINLLDNYKDSHSHSYPCCLGHVFLSLINLL